MKKYIILFFAVLFCGVTACQKQSEPYSDINADIVYNEDGSYIYSITASLPDMDTKSDYDGGGKFTWTSGDQISVLFHKDTDNKFFTLKTSGSGKSVIFNGTIEAGYTIGASDGNGEDKKIWALFPASAYHTYSVGGYPKFYIPVETDLSSRFSANLPMYAMNAEEGAFNFANLACAYKFTVTNINATKAPKIRAVVSNQYNAALSGPIAMSSNYLKLNDSDVSNGASRTVSYVCNVDYDSDPTKGEATFYVSTRAYQAYFQPTIEIRNFSTDFPIKTFTATVKPAALGFGAVKPITLDVDGGEYFTPAIIVDGNYSDWSAVGGTETPEEICKVMKVTSDEYFYYFYLVSDATKRALTETYDYSSGYYYLNFDLDNDPDSGSYTDGTYPESFEALTYLRLFKSDGSTITLNESPYVSTSNGISSDGISVKGSVAGGLMYFEIKIPRSNLPAVTSGNTIRVRSWRSKSGTKIEYSFVVA